MKTKMKLKPENTKLIDSYNEKSKTVTKAKKSADQNTTV